MRIFLSVQQRLWLTHFTFDVTIWDHVTYLNRALLVAGYFKILPYVRKSGNRVNLNRTKDLAGQPKGQHGQPPVNFNPYNS